MKIIYYVFAALMFTPSAFAQNVEDDSIQYKTVDEALKALESDPDAVFSEYEGWKIFKQKGNGRYILWSFTPPEHPAHPTVVRRSIAKINGQLNIDMDALCYSTQNFCDSLMEDFKQINENIKLRESSDS